MLSATAKHIIDLNLNIGYEVRRFEKFTALTAGWRMSLE